MNVINFFTQIAPKNLEPTQPNGAAWFSSALTRSIEAAEELARHDTAQANSCQPALDRRPFRRNNTKFAGSLTFGFHNKRGGFSQDELSRLRQTEAMMTKGQMWGACELNQTPSVEAKWAQDNDNPHAPYHTFWASKQTQAGAGIALFINKQVLTSPGQVVYTHPMGKALAVNISLNHVPFLVVVIHAPSGPTQPAFFQSLIQAITAPQPGRKVILMGDFNFVLRPEVDVIPAAPSSTREQASIEALNQLADHFGGPLDAYRIVYPDRPAATHIPGGPTTDSAGNLRPRQRRLDRIYISPDLIMNMPALTDVRTFDQIQLATTDRNGKTVCSDHAGVTATLRFSDIECPPPRWAYGPPKAKETKEAMKLAVTKFANKGDTTESPATQHTLLAQEIQRICKDAISAERRAKHAPLRSLNTKLKRLRANLQAGMSHTDHRHTIPQQTSAQFWARSALKKDL